MARAAESTSSQSTRSPAHSHPQEPSLAIVPPSQPTTASVSLATTANSHGLHDTLQLGVRSIAADVALKHPLENRIAQVRLPSLHPPLA